MDKGPEPDWYKDLSEYIYVSLNLYRLFTEYNKFNLLKKVLVQSKTIIRTSNNTIVIGKINKWTICRFETVSNVTIQYYYPEQTNLIIFSSPFYLCSGCQNLLAVVADKCEITISKNKTYHLNTRLPKIGPIIQINESLISLSNYFQQVTWTENSIQINTPNDYPNSFQIISVGNSLKWEELLTIWNTSDSRYWFY